MKIRFLTIVLFATAATMLLSCQSDRTNYDVYLCIGQSNMAGRGTMLDSDTVKMDGVWLLDENGNVEPASNPLNKYSSIRKDISLQQISPAYEFAEKISDLTGRKILLVVNARGGTGIDSWQKDAVVKGGQLRYYDEAVRRTRQAMQYGELKGIIWHQGESDGNAPEDYSEKLIKMITDLRADFENPDLPVVVGEIARWLPYGNAVNEQLHYAADILDCCECVSSEGCGMVSDEKDPHFSRDGVILLGSRYGYAMYDLQMDE